MDYSLKNKITLVGIGVFTWLFITSISYQIKLIISSLSTALNLSADSNFYLSEGFKLFSFIILLILFIKWLCKKDLKDNQYTSALLVYMIIGLFILQTIQFLYALYVESYFIDNYSETIIKNQEKLNSGNKLTISSFLELFRYLASGFIFYKSNLYIKNSV